MVLTDTVQITILTLMEMWIALKHNELHQSFESDHIEVSVDAVSEMCMRLEPFPEHDSLVQKLHSVVMQEQAKREAIERYHHVHNLL